MIIDHVKQLRALIAGHGDHHFWMKSVFSRSQNGCGTAACFKGYCELAMVRDKDWVDQFLNEYYLEFGPSIRMVPGAIDARKWLDLDYAQMWALFYQWPDQVDRQSARIIHAWALTRLDEIIETGKINHYMESGNPFVRGVFKEEL